MSPPPLIVIGPLPPPYHGVTVSTKLVLQNPDLQRSFTVEHLDTSDHRSNENIGRWDPQNVFLALRSIVRLCGRLPGRRGVVYLPLSQNAPALFRDCVFITCGTVFRWRVACHLRGGEFDDVYASQRTPMRWLIKSALRRVSSVAVLGASLRSLFDGLVPPDRLAVVPNGTPDIGLDEVERDGCTGLFLSNLRRRKGVIEAIDAALIVVSRHPTARFVMAGDWEDSELEHTVRRRAQPAGDRIEFLPPTTGEAKRRLLGRASFLIFPPVEPEGHPRVVLEAMAAALPVITTDRGAIAETVSDGECGFVLDRPAPAALAERMLRLLHEPALRESMSRAARARYLERFTQEAADRSMACWLEDVATGLDAKGSTTADPQNYPRAA